MKQVITLTLPAHWASALINMDSSGLDVREDAAIDATSKSAGFSLYSAVSCSDESFIARWHDAKGYAEGLQCECLEYYFLR